tara:strand:- start:1038 stop:1904 length:867 start_codon:yes stop_codon:yes gene_type:complete
MSGEIKSLTSTLDDLIAPIVAEAQFVAAEQSIMRNLVKTFAVPMNSGKVLQVPKYPQLTAADLTEANDMTGTSDNQAISTSKTDITIKEVGLMTNVSDLALNHSTSNVISDVGRLFGEAIATKIDTDLVTLFSGFSTQIGAAGQELTVEKIFQAAADLRAASVPGPYFGVFHPRAIYHVKKTLTNTFGSGAQGDLANEALRTGFIGTIAGIQIFESANIDGTTNTDISENAIFSRDALAMAMASDIKIETQRDASARATEIVGVATYGVAELHDSYGVRLTAEAVSTN